MRAFYLFIFSFALPSFSEVIPDLSDLQQPSRILYWNIHVESIAPLPQFEPMLGRKYIGKPGQLVCELYQLYIDEFRPEVVGYISEKESFGYEYDISIIPDCPYEIHSGNDWVGGMDAWAVGCYPWAVKEGGGCLSWKHSTQYRSRYKAFATKDCPLPSRSEYSLKVAVKDSYYGFMCAKPLECKVPFEAEATYEGGFITKTQCVTYCPKNRPFDTDLGFCKPKLKDLDDPLCAEKVLNPVLVSTGEKIERLDSNFNLPGQFPLSFPLSYGSQTLTGIRQNMYKEMVELEPSHSFVRYVQPSWYEGPKYEHYFNLDNVHERLPIGDKQWTSILNWRLFVKENGRVVIKQGEDTIKEFEYLNRAINGEMVQQLGSGWLFIAKSGLKYTFSATGYVTQINHISGEWHRYEYNAQNQVVSIQHSLYGALALTYTNELVSHITLPTGDVYQYQYDELHNLISITNPDNKTKHFHYEDSRYPYALTGITDENGVRYATWEYDSLGRVVSSSHIDGADHGTIDYSNDIVVVKDVLGKETTLEYDANSRLSKVTGQTCDSQGVDSVVNYTFNSTGQIQKKVHNNGKESHYYYDGMGFLQAYRKVSTNGTELREIWDYNANLTLRRKINYWIGRAWNITEYSYNENGLVSSITEKHDRTTRKTQFTYSAANNLVSIDGPRTDVADISYFGYGANGLLSTITNPLNQTMTIDAYDAAGRVLSTSGANNVQTHYSYDNLGRITSVSTQNREITYSYDNIGQLTQIQSGGTVLNYQYDNARRLTRVSDNLGNQISLTNDAKGNIVEYKLLGNTNALHYLHKFSYDKIGRVTKSTSSNNKEWQYLYDLDNNVVEQKDPQQNSVHNSFDAFNRLLSSTDQLTQKTGYTYNTQYNANNEPRQVTDALGRTTQFKYNGFRQVTKRISPDTGTTTYGYDSGGNLKWQQDARGVKTTYTYDALNRVTQIGYPNATENVLLEYDDATEGRFAIGRLSKVTDSSGSREYYYNEFGEVVTQKYTPVGTTTKIITVYSYDNAGNLTSITYPSGRLVSYSYNTAGKVNSVSTTKGSVTQTLASNISYLPFGPLTGLDYGNALQLTMTFNTSYQLTQKSVTGIYDSNYSYDAIDNITTIDELLAPSDSQTYVYDAVSRLTSATGSYDNLAFSYDGIGNRTNKTVSNVDIPYLYENGVLKSVDGITRTYDKAGNTLTDGKAVYSYNQAGRLTQAVIGNESYHYTYNHLGQRVKKQSSVQTRHYHYDLSGLLLSESDELGNTLVEYVYLNGQRLAFITDQVYYVHTNHLDAPLALTNQQGETVWQAKYTPFGSIEVTLNNIANDFTARFPGQYSDNETGLYYNYFRDYDPELGRYIQSDPISLNGGINTYGYVGGNPVSKVDPYGLVEWDLTVILSGGGARFVGGNHIMIKATSKCKNGTQWKVKASGSALTLGASLKYSGIVAADKTGFNLSVINASVNDGLSYIDADMFNGNFGAFSMGFSYGIGKSFDSIDIGKFSRGTFSDVSSNGFQTLGFGSVIGKTTVETVEQCQCSL